MGAVTGKCITCLKAFKNKSRDTITNNHNKSMMATRPTVPVHQTLKIKIISDNVFRNSHQKLLCLWATLYPRQANEALTVLFCLFLTNSF